ncbi:uncharacterized protein VNE69_02061 [Vairimorpha necatrix]|uniref:Core-binding (CB) domain-containing protein n=1 Tax=Vairimorpha necatrix TaxID=6039 RepID=A0AAX4J972_9MICR
MWFNSYYAPSELSPDKINNLLIKTAEYIVDYKNPNIYFERLKILTILKILLFPLMSNDNLQLYGEEEIFINEKLKFFQYLYNKKIEDKLEVNDNDFSLKNLNDNSDALYNVFFYKNEDQDKSQVYIPVLELKQDKMSNSRLSQEVCDEMSYEFYLKDIKNIEKIKSKDIRKWNSGKCLVMFLFIEKLLMNLSALSFDPITPTLMSNMENYLKSQILEFSRKKDPNAGRNYYNDFEEVANIIICQIDKITDIIEYIDTIIKK